MKKYLLAGLFSFSCAFQAQAVVPNYLSLISNTLVCQMSQTGCALYFNGKQQFPFRVITNQSNNNFDFSKFAVNNLRFYIRQNGNKIYLPLDAEISGIKISQRKNQYVYGFMRTANTHFSFSQRAGTLENLNDVFYVSVSKQTYQNFGLSLIIHAEYTDGGDTISSEGSLGNSIALNLLQPQTYDAKDVIVSGENVLSGNSCPPNVSKTKVADFCIQNSLDGWQDKIDGGAGGSGPVFKVEDSEGPVFPYERFYSLSQPLSTVSFRISGSQGSVDSGRVSITQSQPQEMVHHQSNFILWALAPSPFSFEVNSSYFVDLKTFTIDLEPSSGSSSSYSESFFGPERNFLIRFKGLPYIDNYSITKNEHSRNDEIKAYRYGKIMTKCYARSDAYHHPFPNPLDFKSSRNPLTPYQSPNNFCPSDDRIDKNQVSAFFNLQRDTACAEMNRRMPENMQCVCDMSKSDVLNPNFPSMVEKCRLKSDPALYVLAQTFLRRFEESYYVASRENFLRDCAFSSINAHMKAPFVFNFKLPECARLLSEQLESGLDYNGIPAAQLVQKPATTTLLFKVTDDFGNESAIPYTVSFMSYNGLYYLIFN